jgi:hypothetical protein
VTPRLVGPAEAIDVMGGALERSWADAVCGELTGRPVPPLTCRLRPGVSANADVMRVGYGAWHDWRTAWNAVPLGEVDGVRRDDRDVTVRGVDMAAPLELRVETLDGAIELMRRFGQRPNLVDVIVRAREIALRLRDAGAALTPTALRAVCRLSDADAAVVAEAVSWLHQHPDLSGWTMRQLPVPGMHTKWLAPHESLVRRLAGRDVSAEARPRLSVVHFTYTDPAYLATGGRRHDAWTTGDAHAPAYRPRVILVVENRDCRLWFPPMAETIVVEGGGDAAAVSLAAIEWISRADRVVYWGDVDSDGFGILNLFRGEMRGRGVGVESLLMDEATKSRYGHLGVNVDKHGDRLAPSSRRLPHLSPEEAACYASIATAGEVPFRRIEQERIPLTEAASALEELLGP